MMSVRHQLVDSVIARESTPARPIRSGAHDDLESLTRRAPLSADSVAWEPFEGAHHLVHRFLADADLQRKTPVTDGKPLVGSEDCAGPLLSGVHGRAPRGGLSDATQCRSRLQNR